MMLRHLATLTLLSTTAGLAVDFKKDIQPILEKNCYECHSEKTGKKKAGYVFDDLETLKLDINPKGAIVPGKPGESHLFEVVANPNHEAHMPPKGELSPREIEKLREWITEGAALDKDAPKVGVETKKELPPILTWTNFEGKTIKAGFVRLEGESVILRMPANGQEVPYPLAKLDSASQTLAKECAAP
ncbi:MAG TPA: c-type cytochrome domain-containing protein [Prosthecobacter sp.]|nr:c-type cytochrome domain-containing protein [Prosthecobacter sp.]